MTKANTGIWEFTIKHFTLYRMNTYLRSSLGNYERAVALYRWNCELASAYWEAIAYIEVALRNLLDRKMTQRQISLGRSTHWIFDDNYELGRSKDQNVVSTQPFKEIADAMRRVRKNGKPLTPDQIISELSFGFWHQLVSKKQLFLWPELASGFVNAPSRRQSYISNLTLEIRDLRNRIGHHHRLGDDAIESGFKFINQLAGSIDEELVAWIGSNSRINNLLKTNPIKFATKKEEKIK